MKLKTLQYIISSMLCTTCCNCFYFQCQFPVCHGWRIETLSFSSFSCKKKTNAIGKQKEVFWVAPQNCAPPPRLLNFFSLELPLMGQTRLCVAFMCFFNRSREQDLQSHSTHRAFRFSAQLFRKNQKNYGLFNSLSNQCINSKE